MERLSDWETEGIQDKSLRARRREHGAWSKEQGAKSRERRAGR